jgi:transglutaminase-like putative cysteine protease
MRTPHAEDQPGQSGSADRNSSGGTEDRLERLDRRRSNRHNEQGFRFSRLGLELGILLANLAACLSIGRLFTDTRSLSMIAIAVLLTHGVAIAARAANLPFLLSAIISALAIGGSSLAASFPDTVHHLVIPTRSTWDALQVTLTEAFDLFTSVRAPTPSALGFSLIAIAAAWVVGTASDAIAFRLGFLVEAVVPPGVVIVVVAALATERYRLVSLLAFTAAVSLVVASARVRELSREAWLGLRPRKAGIGGVGIACALALGVVAWTTVNPPSWAEQGLIDLQEDNNKPATKPRIAGNPLVSTRAHLVELTNEKMFTVTSDVSAYWRMTSLDQYQNEQWTSSRATYSSEGTELPDDAPTVLVQVQSFDRSWLPVPANPVAVSPTADPNGNRRGPVKFDRMTNSVLIDVPRRGDRYTVAYAKQAPEVALTDTQRERSLALPSTLADRVPALAQQVTAGLGTDTARAKALERFFQTGFTYDLEVARISNLGLEEFLFNQKRGYCEQFAGSFAVMARTLGIPSRVAIGYIPNERTGRVYQVRGRDAHAWPEVYIDGRWVAFEPTPGRGVAGPGPQNPQTPTTVPPTTAAAPQASTVPPNEAAPALPAPQPGFGVSIRMLLQIVGALLGFALLLCVPTVVRSYRSKRGLVADADAVPLSLQRGWVGLEDDVAWVGSGRPPSMAVETWLDTLPTLPEDAWPTKVREVGDQLELLRYRPPDIDADATATVAALAAKIETTRKDLHSQLGIKRKMRRFLSFNPRPRARD